MLNTAEHIVSAVELSACSFYTGTFNI